MIKDTKFIQQVLDSLNFKFPYTAEEWIEKNFVMENYHCHNDFSNVSTVDSPSSCQYYANRIKELGGKCLYSTSHGNQGNQFEVYTVAEKEGLRYVHATEAYWVKNRLEKDNANCHIFVGALDGEARKDINYMLSIANEDGYYYKPRIDLELLFQLPKDRVIVTSACIAGWKYEDAEDIWLNIYEYFGGNFYLEVQSHNTDAQKELNKKIVAMADKYNIQIIAGLDSHYIAEDDSIKRDQILKYKKINYDNEDGWYMDFPSGDIVLERFLEQGVLTDAQIIKAMANTQIFACKCQEIKLDKSFKIPCIYKDKTYEERVELLKQYLNNEYKKETLKSKEKLEGIRYEVEQIVDSKVVDYFLTNEKLVDIAVNEEGGILTTTSRGSASSFITNKLLGFTTLDRFNSEVPIYPERFLTKERVQAGQMPDIDFNVAEQEPFVRAAKKLLGEHSCYPLMAVEKLKEKAAWQLYAGANDVDFHTANEISTYISQYNEELKYADDDEKDLIRIEDFIPDEYIELYKQSIEYQGITSNLKIHACFTGETLVLTDNGYKEIKNIKIGDNVLTHNGEYHTVLNTMVNPTEELYYVRNVGEVVKTTANHPFYVITKTDDSLTNFTAPRWKEAQELTKNDYVGYPINQESKMPTAPGLAMKDSWWSIGGHMGEQSIAFNKEWMNDIINSPVHILKAFLEGYFYGSGSLFDEYVVFSIEDKELAYGLQQCIHKVYHTPCPIKIIEEKIDGSESKKYYYGYTRLLPVRYGRSSFYKDGMIWMQIEDVSVHKTSCDVYNLTVEKDNSYTVYNMAVHNCGYLLFDGDIRREVGLISAISETTQERTLAACVEGNYLDAFGYVKDDFLIVDVVGLIDECFKAIGKTVPTFDELREMIDGDEKTWDIYKQGITCCVNQVEKYSTAQKVMKYQPANLGELSAFIAGIRPGFASLLPRFIRREEYSTGEKKIDDLLEDSSHYMIYQESIMKVLAYLGLEMGETYKVIKSISKKKLKGEAKDNLKKKLKDAWMADFGNLDNFDGVWNVIEDSARYAFNCLSKDTMIYRPANNKNKKSLTIEEMFNIKNDKEYAIATGHYDLHKKYNKYGYGKTLSLFDDGKFHYNDIVEIYDAGLQDTFTVKTKSGKTIDCTMEHKFPTPNGKKKLKDLNIGDALFAKGATVFLDEIMEIKFKCNEHVYNVSMADPAHNFVVNDGIVTSNSPHALSMAGDSAYIAWFKSHYTATFYEVAINHYQKKNKKGKIKDLIREITAYYGYRVGDYRFRDDNRKVTIDESNKIIYPNMSSLKGIQKVAPNILWELRDIECKKGIELIKLIDTFKNENGEKLNSSTIDKLIKINYFQEFGDINYMLQLYDFYKTKKYGTCSTLKKEAILSKGWNIEGCYNKETAAQYRELDNVKLVERLMELNPPKPCTDYDRMQYQKSVLGYTDIGLPNEPVNHFIVEAIEINSWGTPFATIRRLYDGETVTYKVDKKYYEQYKFNEGDIIKAIFQSKNVRKPVLDEKTAKKKFVKTGETVSVLTAYSWVQKMPL